MTLYKEGATYATASVPGKKENSSLQFVKDGVSYKYVFRSERAEEPYHTSNRSGTAYFTAEGATLSVKYMETYEGFAYSLPRPVKTGYVFVYWLETATGQIYTDDTEFPARSVNLVAVFTQLGQTGDVYSDEVVTIDTSACSKTFTDVSSQKEQYRETYSQQSGNYCTFSHILRVELTSDDLGGLDKVDTQFSLSTFFDGLVIQPLDGYQISGGTSNWGYGSNLVRVDIWRNGESIHRYYLFDVYVKQDYFVKIYDGKTMVGEQDFRNYRVIEGQTLPADAAQNVGNFTFVGFANSVDDQEFDVSTVVEENLALYQRYQAVTVLLDAGEGATCLQNVEVEPYVLTPFLKDSLPARAGHTFIGWKFDGDYQISNDGSPLQALTADNNYTTLTAQWDTNKYLLYKSSYDVSDYFHVDEPLFCKVEFDSLRQPTLTYIRDYYYGDKEVVNLDDYPTSGNEFPILTEYGQTFTLQSTCDEFAMSFNGWMNTKTISYIGSRTQYDDLTINIEGDQGYQAFWNVYWLGCSQNNSAAGEVSLSGGKTPIRGGIITPSGSSTLPEGKQAVEEGATATFEAEKYIGYDFLGWFNGETMVSNSAIYQVTMGRENMTLEARFQASSDMENFKFTSTKTTCILTGVNDKTATTLDIPTIFTGVQQGALSGMNNLQNLTLSFVGENATSGGNLGYLFSASNAIGISVPESLKKVVLRGNLYANSFSNCTKLQEVELSANVWQIPENCFSYCSSLQIINLPSGLNSIGANAFKNCTALTALSLPQTVSFIGENAFVNSGIATINFPDALENIGNYAFAGMAIVDVELPTTVSTVGNYAFANCTSLTHFVLNDNVASLGSYLFYGCDSLSTVDLPTSFTTIPTGLFGGFTGLTTFTVGANVTEICERAFDKCTNLQTVIFESSSKIAKIGDNAFDSTALKEFTFPSTTSIKLQIGANLFANSAIEKISLTAKICGLEDEVGGTVPENAFRGLTALTNVKFVSGISSIGTSAFEDCTALNTIEGATNIVKIGDRAFYNCFGITSLSLSMVQYLGESSLSGTSITELAFSSQLKEIKPLAIPSTLTSAIFATNSNGTCNAFCVTTESGSTDTWRPYHQSQYYGDNATALKNKVITQKCTLTVVIE